MDWRVPSYAEVRGCVFPLRHAGTGSARTLGGDEKFRLEGSLAGVGFRDQASMEAPAASRPPDRRDTLLEDADFVVCRSLDATDPASPPRSTLVVTPRSEHPRPQIVRMLEHEHSLRDELDP